MNTLDFIKIYELKLIYQIIVAMLSSRASK